MESTATETPLKVLSVEPPEMLEKYRGRLGEACSQALPGLENSIETYWSTLGSVKSSYNSRNWMKLKNNLDLVPHCYAQTKQVLFIHSYIFGMFKTFFYVRQRRESTGNPFRRGCLAAIR